MSFSADISRFVEKANGNVDKAVRQALMLAAQNIVMRSPVDTGRFRANWQFGVGARDTSTAERFDPTGATTIGRLIAEIKGTNAGQVYYLSNSLPYAMRLENGWSKQAPNGMVRLTAMDLPRQIEEYAASLK